MKILFISHTYPPVVGGVESHNYELYTWLSKKAEVKLVANKKRSRIPFFIAFVPFYAILLSRKYDAILLGSCILGNVGWFIKLFTKKPIITVAHGLDLTWKNKIYQKLWVRIFLKKLDKLIAVGNETVRVAMGKGIDPRKIVFIPNGVDTEKNFVLCERSDLEHIVGENLGNKKVLLTSGRLAKRKGVAWFLENVFSKLPENVIYAIAGSGKDEENIRKIISKENFGKRVKMLGYVPDETRNILFNSCDLFIQPNIKVEGDMEGFGISVIEAAVCKLPVVASELEGLKDAIKHEENGFLVEPHNADAFAYKIMDLLRNDQERKAFGEKAREYICENYSWEKIAEKYLEEITKTVNFKAQIPNFK